LPQTYSSERQLPRDFDIRFAVGDAEGARSSVWRVWKARKTDDIYITPRGAGRVFKISLHANDGYCHLAITAEEVAHPTISGVPPRRGHRAITSWTRLEGPTDGYAASLKLLFAAEFLPARGAPLEKPTQLLPIPSLGHAVVVDFLYSRVPLDQMGLAANQVVLGRVGLSTGETVSVIAGTVDDFDAGAFRSRFSPVGNNTEIAFLTRPPEVSDEHLRGLIILPSSVGPLYTVEIGPDFNAPNKQQQGLN